MFKTASAATLALLLTSTSAYALEGKALFDKIVADTGTTVTYDSAEERGADSVTFRNMKVSGDGVSVTLDTLVIDGFREEGDLVRVDSSSADNVTYEFPAGGDDATKRGIMKVTQATSSDVLAPAAIIVATSFEGITGRMQIGEYVLNGITADFDGDGTLESSMDKLGFAGLDTPLQFRYTPEQIKAASGEVPAPLKMASFTIDGTKVTFPQGEFTLGNFAIADINVPATLDAEPLDWAQTYRTLTMGPMNVALGGSNVFSMEKLAAKIEQTDGSRIDQISSAEGIYVDATKFPGQGAQIVKALGYNEFRGRMDANGSYDPEQGVAALDSFLIDFDDVAELSMSMKISGYTPEVARKMNELSMQQNVEGKPADPMAVMAVLSDVKLDGVRLALKDDSLTNRVLTFQAAQMNTKPEQLAQMGPMFVGMGMAQLGMPEFTQQVSTAVGSFLQQPGTLSIAAEPAQPVSFGDIFVAAQQAPKAIIDLLNVQVVGK